MKAAREWTISCPHCGRGVALRPETFDANEQTYACECSNKLSLDVVAQGNRSGWWRPCGTEETPHPREISYLLPPHQPGAVYAAELRLP